MKPLLLITQFFILCAALLLVGCKEYSEISVSEFDKMMEESAKHSMSKWVLVDENESHYFIEYSRGFNESSSISVSKNDIFIHGDNSYLPRVLKFVDIEKK